MEPLVFPQIHISSLNYGGSGLGSGSRPLVYIIRRKSSSLSSNGEDERTDSQSIISQFRMVGKYSASGERTPMIHVGNLEIPTR